MARYFPCDCSLINGKHTHIDGEVYFIADEAEYLDYEILRGAGFFEDI